MKAVSTSLLRKRPMALLSNRDQLFLRRGYARAFEMPSANKGEKLACRTIARLVALAHDRACARNSRAHWCARSSGISKPLRPRFRKSHWSHAACATKAASPFKASVKTAKSTQQQNVQVGDAPNHIARVYDVHRSYLSNPPTTDGLKLMEEWLAD
jgi:hypothetical protein